MVRLQGLGGEIVAESPRRFGEINVLMRVELFGQIDQAADDCSADFEHDGAFRGT